MLCPVCRGANIKVLDSRDTRDGGARSAVAARAPTAATDSPPTSGSRSASRSSSSAAGPARPSTARSNTYNAINQKMHQAVSQLGGRIDAIFFCPHAKTDQCNCRKPATGLFSEIMQRYGTNLKNVPAIGDSLRDLQAAATAGAVPVLVLTGKG